jgi:hypothetical protein
MSMGDYDAAEHERREQLNTVEATSDDDRTSYEGTVKYDSGDSTEALLEQFREIVSR